MRDAAAQPGLFDVPRARWSDPKTSRRAAESVPLFKVTETQEHVLILLRIGGPGTDEEVEDRFRSYWPERKTSPQSLRSRRAELCRKGLVVDSGDRRRTQFDQLATVWRAT